MVGLIVLLLVALSFDWAKNCKAVNYKYTQYKNKVKYDYGCKKGCVGYANDTSTPPIIGDDGTKFDGERTVQETCVECKTITKDFVSNVIKQNGYGWTATIDIADEEMEKVCNGGQQFKFTYTFPGSISGNDTQSSRVPRGQCLWNSKKKTCGAGSCSATAAMSNCNSWKNGKCEKNKYDDCGVWVDDIDEIYNQTGGSDLGTCDGKSYSCISSCYPAPTTSFVSCNNMTDYYYYAGNDPVKGCAVVKKITADQQKECKYKCDHPGGYSYTPYEYSKGVRKRCHKIYGCMYSAGDTVSECSYLAVWAFVLILVIVILVGLGIIALVCFLIFKLCCGNKSTKVDPSAAPAPAAKSAPQAAPAAAAPATQAPPPEVGPYVVIKLGKQELKTKKVESAVWGQSIVFTGLGPEDDDVIFELRDNSDALLGSTDVRIPDYVNAKKRATINLKNGEEVIGVLEADIEIQVQEEPEVKITGVFFIDKFTKPI